MIEYRLLVPPLLISVNDFAFRGRALSLLAAYSPGGSPVPLVPLESSSCPSINS